MGKKYLFDIFQVLNYTTHNPEEKNLPIRESQKHSSIILLIFLPYNTLKAIFPFMIVKKKKSPLIPFL